MGRGSRNSGAGRRHAGDRGAGQPGEEADGGRDREFAACLVGFLTACRDVDEAPRVDADDGTRKQRPAPPRHFPARIPGRDPVQGEEEEGDDEAPAGGDQREQGGAGEKDGPEVRRIHTAAVLARHSASARPISEQGGAPS